MPIGAGPGESITVRFKGRSARRAGASTSAACRRLPHLQVRPDPRGRTGSVRTSSATSTARSSTATGRRSGGRRQPVSRTTSRVLRRRNRSTYAPVDETALQVGDIEVRTLRGKLLHHVHRAPAARRGRPRPAAAAERQLHDRRPGHSTGPIPPPTAAPRRSVRGIQIQEYKPNGKRSGAGTPAATSGSRRPRRLVGSGRTSTTRPTTSSTGTPSRTTASYMLLSFRHLDAIYKITRPRGRSSGSSAGRRRPRASRSIGDPHGEYPLGGQHDVRLSRDGTITVHDNRSELGKPPRTVRYRINEDRGTAKFVESVADRRIKGSICCGSARRLDDGGWLVGWGGNGVTAPTTSSAAAPSSSPWTRTSPTARTRCRRAQSSASSSAAPWTPWPTTPDAAPERTDAGAWLATPRPSPARSCCQAASSSSFSCFVFTYGGKRSCGGP